MSCDKYNVLIYSNLYFQLNTVVLSFLKRYRYRDQMFQAYLGLLTTLNDLNKNDLISFSWILKYYDIHL